MNGAITFQGVVANEAPRLALERTLYEGESVAVLPDDWSGLSPEKNEAIASLLLRVQNRTWDAEQDCEDEK